ncbi:MAG: hypothetical protein ACKVTZ_20940 [Bacteroidia bacterium]
MKNLIETQFTANDLATFDALLAQLEALVDGKLMGLSSEERQTYGSVNEQNKLFVNKVNDYHNSSPQLSSPDVDWNEFAADYQARHFLETRLTRLQSIVSQMESTKILHDYDNYQDALDDYSYSQYKAGAGKAGFTEKVADLKQFFNRSKKVTPPAEEG